VEHDDGIPELAIGRIPVITEAELYNYIDKLVAYSSANGGWMQTSLMLADNPDLAGNFPVDSDYIAELLPKEFSVEKIYLSDFPLETARQNVLTGFNNGALLINYIGHGGLDRLADEGLLTSNDVLSLANHPKLPVITAMTCLAGLFSIPGYDSISELLVMKPNGGAIAMWAPTGLSINEQAKVLDEEFIRTVYGPDQERTLGLAIISAFEKYHTHRSERFIFEIYNLLGDPALELH